MSDEEKEDRYLRLLNGFQSYITKEKDNNIDYITPIKKLNDGRYLSKQDREQEKEIYSKTSFFKNVWRGGFISEERFWLSILLFILLTLISYIFNPVLFQTKEIKNNREIIVGSLIKEITIRDIKYVPETSLNKLQENNFLGKSVDWWINFITWKILFIFSIYFSVSQYNKAKKLRIETQNRIAMASFWYNINVDEGAENYAPYVLPSITKITPDNSVSFVSSAEIESPLGKIKVTP